MHVVHLEIDISDAVPAPAAQDAQPGAVWKAHTHRKEFRIFAKDAISSLEEPGDPMRL
jgi:hypothetical protein